MSDIESRKRLLVAESEVYRQTLRLDLQNLRIYTFRAQRRFATYVALKPLLMVALPFAASLFSRRGKERVRRPRSLLSRVMAGWRMYKNIQPLVASLMAQYASGQKPGSVPKSEPSEGETPAAMI